MRTTVTLEPDVEALVRAMMRERGLAFKDALNEAVRAGPRPASPTKRFRTPTYDLGEPVVPLTKALQLADELADDEQTRKLALGK